MNETEEEKTSEWALLRQQWAANGVTVMHLPTRVIGKVEKHYDGDVDKWQDPNGVYCVTPVLKLANGHGFTAVEEKDFLVLDDVMASFYKDATQATALHVAKLAMAAAMMKPPIPLADTAVLLSAMLREQARQFEVAARNQLKKEPTT
jgi:hypothetical protein